MRKFSLRAPSPAMVIASLSLFIALGGTGYAASQLTHSSPASAAKKKKKVTDPAADKALFNKLIPSAHVAFAAAAGTAATAGSAATAAHASSADSATSATTATTATSANALQGLAANQLVRATTAANGNSGDPCSGGAALTEFESTTFTNVVTNKVNAPVAGVLLVMGHTSAEFASVSTPKTSLRLLGRLTVDGTQAGPESEASLRDDEVTCKEGRTMSLDTAVSVAAGEHTVAFQVAKSTTTGGEGKAYVGNGSVTTLFVPFGNAGKQGALSAVHLPGPEGKGNG